MTVIIFPFVEQDYVAAATVQVPPVFKPISLGIVI